MADSTKGAASSPESTSITLDELIRGQLAGKLVALARYDEILWKIRGGYVAVMYAMLAFLVGKESKVVEVLGSSSVVQSLFPISLGLSVCALFVDLAFLLAKLRVVAARNRLSDLAAIRARSGQLTKEESEELLTVLHISGEALTLPPGQLLLSAIWSLLLVYFVTPVSIYLLVH